MKLCLVGDTVIIPSTPTLAMWICRLCFGVAGFITRSYHKPKNTTYEFYFLHGIAAQVKTCYSAYDIVGQQKRTVLTESKGLSLLFFYVVSFGDMS